MKLIINFLKKLFSDSGEVGSKRVVGFGAFALIATTVIVQLAGGTIVKEFLFWGLLLLVAACFGLNAIIDIFKLRFGSKVASDILKEDSSSNSTTAAKDIVQDTKTNS